jgi:hypothetical protein
MQLRSCELPWLAELKLLVYTSRLAQSIVDRHDAKAVPRSDSLAPSHDDRHVLSRSEVSLRLSLYCRQRTCNCVRRFSSFSSECCSLS